MLKSRNDIPGTPFQLPERVITKLGASFDPRAPIWDYDDGTAHVHLSFANAPLTEELLLSFKKTAIWYAENSAPITIQQMFNKLLSALKFLNEDLNEPHSLITEKHLSTVRENWRQRFGHDRQFAMLRPFVRKWFSLGYPGVTEEADKYLEEVKLTQGPVGAHVTTMDPERGPFTDIEREALLDAATFKYQDGEVDLQTYVLSWVVALFGQRPEQYALMKLCDLDIISDECGFRYKLRIPMAKGHGVTVRTEFIETELNSALGSLLAAYKTSVMHNFVGLLDDPEQAPFFPEMRRRKNTKQFAYHPKAARLSYRIRAFYKSLRVRSERTGQAININAYRWRYTLGTNCVREGLGEAATARRLGHRTTGNVKVYFQVQGAYELMDRIDFAVAAKLGVYAQAFKGLLITNEWEKDRSPQRMLLNPEIDPKMENAPGHCGDTEYCNFNKPIACYTCPIFRAWLDGRHDDVYAYLQKERERLVRTRSSPMIVAIHDRTMTAVAQVILMCKEEYARREPLTGKLENG